MNPTTLNLCLALLLLSLTYCICHREILSMLTSLLDWLVNKQAEPREEIRKEKEKP